MTPFSEPHATAPAPFRIARMARNAIVKLAKDVWRRADNIKQVRLLAEMDDHRLADIGLTKGDVRAAIRTSGRIPPMVRLRLLAVQRRAAARALAMDRVAGNRRKPGRAHCFEDA